MPRTHPTRLAVTPYSVAGSCHWRTFLPALAYLYGIVED